MKKIEISTAWRSMNVLSSCDRQTSHLSGRTATRYDLRDRYERAQAKKDPLLAPHGFLRALRPYSIHHAKEFLENFGPLVMQHGKQSFVENGTLTVDLGQFWSLQLRFRLIAELWENLNDKEKIPKLLLDIYNR